MKKLSKLLFAICIVSLTACSSDDETPTDNVTDDPIVSNVARNTVKTSDHETALTHFTFVRGELQGSEVFSIAAFEYLPTNISNPGTGDGVLFYFKEIPTSNTNLTHFGGFELESGQFFLNNLEVNNQKWYTPYVGDDPTGTMTITIENGVATFTAENIVLSDNYVAPITETKAVSFSVSVNVSYFDSDNTGFVELSE
jgi:hypothetical protein